MSTLPNSKGDMELFKEVSYHLNLDIKNIFIIIPFVLSSVFVLVLEIFIKYNNRRRMKVD